MCLLIKCSCSKKCILIQDSLPFPYFEQLSPWTWMLYFIVFIKLFCKKLKNKSFCPISVWEFFRKELLDPNTWKHQLIVVMHTFIFAFLIISRCRTNINKRKNKNHIKSFHHLAISQPQILYWTQLFKYVSN